METILTTPDNWHDVLKVAEQGGRLWYQAPLDVAPVPVHVRKVFKNGKIRLSNHNIRFTADKDHLSRFRVKL